MGDKRLHRIYTSRDDLVYKLINIVIQHNVVYYMVTIYVFEAGVVKMGTKYLIYSPREYQERLRRLHGRKVKVIVIEESD